MTRLPNKRGKKVFFLRFAEEGFPCGEDDIQIEEVENLQTTIFKPGFNWFTSLEKATKARNEIIESIRPIPYLRGEAMSEIRKDFDRAYQERYGIKPDETHAALWAAKWVAERCAKQAEHQATICGSSMSRQSTSHDIAYNIRQLSKELDHE